MERQLTEIIEKHLEGNYLLGSENKTKMISEILGLFNVSGTPIKQAISLIDGMTADQRFDVFGEFCTYCGDKDPSCQCWNDE